MAVMNKNKEKIKCASVTTTQKAFSSDDEGGVLFSATKKNKYQMSRHTMLSDVVMSASSSTVETTTLLDELMSFDDSDRPLILKFDIEGSERDFFSGFPGTIQLLKDEIQFEPPEILYIIGEISWDYLRWSEEQFKQHIRKFVGDMQEKAGYYLMSDYIERPPIGASKDKPYVRCNAIAGSRVEFVSMRDVHCHKGYSYKR